MPGQKPEAHVPPPPPAEADKPAERKPGRARLIAARMVDKVVLFLGVLAAATLAPDPVGIWDAATSKELLKVAGVVTVVYFIGLEK
jgi:hypothetical protein